MFYHLIKQRFGWFVSKKNDFNLYCVRSRWSTTFKTFSFFIYIFDGEVIDVSLLTHDFCQSFWTVFTVTFFFHSEYCSIRDWLPPCFWALLCQPVWEPERIYRPAWPVWGTELGTGKTSLFALRRQIWIKTWHGYFFYISFFCFLICLRVKVSPTGGGSLLSCPHSWMERLIRMWMTSAVMTSWWHRYKLCSTFIYFPHALRKA